MSLLVTMASIIKKILWLLLMVSIFSIFWLNFGFCYSPNATIPFNLNELSGQIIIISPLENSTYSDPDIVIRAGLHIGGIEYAPNTHYVPYQNISCVYSLDGSEWQEMSLVSVGGHESFCSLVNPFWYSNTWLNYTATLHRVSGGSHYLRIDVKPDYIEVRDINSQDQPLVNFNVINQPSTQLENTPIIGSVLVTIFAAGSLIYIKKSKKPQISHR